MGGAERTVRVERRGEEAQVVLVTLDRPEALNALNTALAQDLYDVLEELRGDGRVRCVVVTGSGDRAFCAGADLKERSGIDSAQWHAQHEIFDRTFHAIRTFQRPIFAAVNGVAAGGGLEIALSTDFIIAGEDARFGQPEVRLGIMPGGGATRLLMQAVPLGLARQMMMTGELVDAGRAIAGGLVNSLHPAAELIPAAIQIADSIARNSPVAVHAVRRAVYEGLGAGVDEAIDNALGQYRQLVEHPDRVEGVRAFNEKRRAAFQDLSVDGDTG